MSPRDIFIILQQHRFIYISISIHGCIHSYMDCYLNYYMSTVERHVNNTPSLSRYVCPLLAALLHPSGRKCLTPYNLLLPITSTARTFLLFITNTYQLLPTHCPSSSNPPLPQYEVASQSEAAHPSEGARLPQAELNPPSQHQPCIARRFVGLQFLSPTGTDANWISRPARARIPSSALDRLTNARP